VQRRFGVGVAVVLGVVLVLSLAVLASCSKTNTTTTIAPTTSSSQASGTSSTQPSSTTSVAESTTTTGGPTTTAAPPTTTTAAAADAAALYAQNCAGCHPDHPGAGLTADQLTGIVRNGTSGMPGFASKLSDAQIASVSALLAAPASSTTTTVGNLSTSALYSKFCAGCHSSRPGAGITAGQAAGIIRNGTAGMPGFASKLTSAQISSLGAYTGRPTATTTTTGVLTAAELYTKLCAGCHPSHPGAGLTSDQVTDIIRNGFGTVMPGYASKLNETQISSLGTLLTGSGSSTTTTTAPGHPAWKPLTFETFALELNKVGITVVGSGPTGTYTKDGNTISWDDLLDYLPSGEFYKDDEGYHYVQEEGAINPNTGLPAAVTKPPTTTTTTTTTSTTTTTVPSTTTTTGGTTTTTGAGRAAAALFTQYCKSCHSGGAGAGQPASQIVAKLTTGSMSSFATNGSMTPAEIAALAAYLAGGGK
jgi:mono/diheme cytochrome c family protein